MLLVLTRVWSPPPPHRPSFLSLTECLHACLLGKGKQGWRGDRDHPRIGTLLSSFLPMEMICRPGRALCRYLCHVNEEKKGVDTLSTAKGSCEIWLVLCFTCRQELRRLMTRDSRPTHIRIEGRVDPGQTHPSGSPVSTKRFVRTIAYG